ncbi:carbohydrate kinase [Pendulispora albinea]|uniref:Carbohydrate kinase n=1 Tax=Pendulispora albinea TaxID=2741071 RepID=A0ABZ2MBK4_9BACT
MKTHYEVITFGEVLWDLFEDGKDTYRRFVGGSSANVAVALARQGVRVAVVGGIGRDRFGDELAARLDALGVDTALLARLPERTALTFIARGQDAEPHFMNYRHASADMALSARHITPAMAHATWVHLGTSTLLTHGLSEATRAFEAHAIKHRALKSLDLNARPRLWESPSAAVAALRRIAPGSALIKASLGDLESFGLDAVALRAMAPEAVLVLTRGPGEATAYGAHGEVSLPAQAAECIDATGAGDSFIAGVLAHLVRREVTPSSPEWADANLWTQALAQGHSLGALAVSKLGGS